MGRRCPGGPYLGECRAGAVVLDRIASTVADGFPNLEQRYAPIIYRDPGNLYTTGTSDYADSLIEFQADLSDKSIVSSAESACPGLLLEADVERTPAEDVPGRGRWTGVRRSGVATNRSVSMKTKRWLGAVPLVSAMLAMTASAGADGIRWEGSFNKAKRKAKELDQLVMVDFWADW